MIRAIIIVVTDSIYWAHVKYWLYTLQVLFYLNLMITLKGMYYYYPHFTEESSDIC